MYLILWAKILLVSSLNFAVEDIIRDMYYELTEDENVEYTQFESDMIDLYRNPINLNACTEENLQQIPFLTPRVIDNILIYQHDYGFDKPEELSLIEGLKSYQVRNLMYFVTIGQKAKKKTYPSDIFRFAKHEITARIDARNIEHYEGDPVFAQVRYKFNYANRVQFGFTVRRDPGAPARDMLYGGYIELRELGPMKTIVAGNYDAEFGCGLVAASSFHLGKNGYVSNVGYREGGLRKHSSVSVSSLHGIGATARLYSDSTNRVELSAWYSMTRQNDSTHRHVVGTNLSYRRHRLAVGATYVQKLYTDSIRPYNTTYYNHNYFRGRQQAVLGVNARYNFGIVDVFGEVAMAQSGSHVLRPKWGFGANVGARIYPAQDINIVALYRYYSPTFDNDLGYGFSESSRVGDEHGGYVGVEVNRWRRWTLSGYADAWYNRGPRFGVRDSATVGVDSRLEAEYRHSLSHSLRARFRTRVKGIGTRSQSANNSLTNRLEGRLMYSYQQAGWRVQTEVDVIGNAACATAAADCGYAISQDVEYAFRQVPLTIQARAMGFRLRSWDNRLYSYENDVLYSFAIPAIYGVGGRAYLNLRWQIIKQLSLYFRGSFTLYSNDWAVSRKMAKRSDTDLHLMLRICL